MRSPHTLRRLGMAAVAGTMCLTLAACSGGSGGSAGGESVPAGATKDQYVEALAGIEPVNLKVQSNQPPGVGQSAALDSYAEKVEDWSGGKITFEIVYAGAIAPIGEAGRAMADGLVDMAFWSYGTSIDSFPLSAAVQETFFMQDDEPLSGSLQLFSAAVDQSAHTPELREEVESQGLQPLLPLIPFGRASMLCKDVEVSSLEEMQGTTVVPVNAAVAAEAKALGASTVNVQFAELYDAMQRGVTDCVLQPDSSMLLGGLYEVGNQWTRGLKTTAPPAAFDMSQAVWQDLPLPAQQLLWDSLDALIATYVSEFIVSMESDVLLEAEAQKVQLQEFDSGVVNRIQEFHDEKLAELEGRTIEGVDGASIVDGAREYHSKWGGIIAEFGLDPGVPWSEYPQWLEENPVDTLPYAQRVMEEIADQRPE